MEDARADFLGDYQFGWWIKTVSVTISMSWIFPPSEEA